jgi:hypothetical protein
LFRLRAANQYFEADNVGPTSRLQNLMSRNFKTRGLKGYGGASLFLFAIYLSQSWPWSGAEVAAGALAVTLVMALLHGMRKSVDIRYSLRFSWFSTLGLLLASRTPKDCVLVLSSLRRQRSGEICAVPFNKEAFGKKALNAGHRAMTVTGVSVGPNTVVIDVDPKDDWLIVHQLVPTGSPPGGGNQLWPIAP